MARLSKEQWSEMRAEWEASPRQGLTWLTAAAGGRWDVTEEPIRKRRAAENWQKPVNMGDVVREARLAADRLSVARAASPAADPDPADADPIALMGAVRGVEGGVDVGSLAAKKADPDTTDAEAVSAQAVDLRTALIDKHREEWNHARRLVWQSMVLGAQAKGFEKAKFAKIATEALRNIQEGERRAWGLDADLIDFENLTDKQLEAMAAGKTIR